MNASTRITAEHPIPKDDRRIILFAAWRTQPPPGACRTIHIIFKVFLCFINTERENPVSGVIPALGSVFRIVRILQLTLLNCRLLLFGKGFFIVFAVQPFSKAALLPSDILQFVMVGSLADWFFRDQEGRFRLPVNFERPPSFISEPKLNAWFQFFRINAVPYAAVRHNAFLCCRSRIRIHFL